MEFFHGETSWSIRAHVLDHNQLLLKLSSLSSLGWVLLQRAILSMCKFDLWFALCLQSIMAVVVPETLVIGLGVLRGVTDLELRGSGDSIPITSSQTALPAKEVCIAK